MLQPEQCLRCPPVCITQNGDLFLTRIHQCNFLNMFNQHFLAVRHGTLPRFLGLSFLNGLDTTRLCRRERWAKLGPWPPVAGSFHSPPLVGSRAHRGAFPPVDLRAVCTILFLFAVHVSVAPFTWSGYIFEKGSDSRSVQPFKNIITVSTTNPPPRNH